MSWSWTLYRYLGMQFLFGVAIVLGGFLTLAFSIDIVELMNRTAGRELSSATIVAMAFLQLPDLGQRLLPFSVLLGGVFCFVQMARRQELVATRAAGVSAWDFLIPPLAVAVFIGVFHIAAVTPLSSRLLAQFSALEAKYIKGQASQLSLGRNGLWLRQGDASGQSVIHALKVDNQGAHLTNVIVFLYGAGDRYQGRIDAKSADLAEGAWLMKEAFVSGNDGRVTRYDRYVLKTTLTRARILESFAPPNTLSLWALPDFIASAQNAGFATIRYRLYLYNLLALPLMFAAMVFMAASFSLKVSRGGGLGKVVMIGALAGFGVYFFGEMTTALGRSGILPAGLAATAPALAAILIGMTLVFHQEDG